LFHNKRSREKGMNNSTAIKKDFFNKVTNQNPDAVQSFDKMKESFIYVSNAEESIAITQSFLDIEESLKQIKDEVGQAHRRERESKKTKPSTPKQRKTSSSRSHSALKKSRRSTKR
jgi:hypothetical protein